MWLVVDAATVGIACACPCETGWRAGDHDDTASRRCRLRCGGQPASRPTTAPGCDAAWLDHGGHRRARTAHRRRRPEHVHVRFPRSLVRSTGGLRHRSRPRNRAQDLRRSGPHRSAGGRCGPTGDRAAVRPGGPRGPDLLDHLRAQGEGRLLDRVLLRQPAHPRYQGVGNRFRRSPFRQTGVRRRRHDLAGAGVRAQAAGRPLSGRPIGPTAS